ncbi:DUF6207 family protein [Streptomyces pharetrae]|uniref:DUF6207 family protein n=1 Tax=Streptomyces pharetrae TaxID=291370 RepID=UPI003F4DFF73
MTSDRTTRDPQQLGVRLRCLDVRQELSTQPCPCRSPHPHSRLDRPVPPLPTSAVSVPAVGGLAAR